MSEPEQLAREMLGAAADIYRGAMLNGAGQMRIDWANIDKPLEPASVIEDPFIQQQKTLDYINELAQILEVDLDTVPIYQVFSNQNKGLITDKAQINTRFVEFLKSRTDEPRNIYLPPSFVDQLRTQERRTERKGLLLKGIKDARRDYQESRNRMVSAIQEMADMKKALYRPERSLIKEIQDLTGFFKPHPEASDSNYLSFLTDNCVINYRRPGDNKRFKINFGKFEIRANFKKAKIFVHPYQDNVKFKKWYHPFVSSDGEICFGESGDIATDFIAKAQWRDYFRLLHTLLCSYNSEAYPFIAIETFWYFGMDKDNLHPWRLDSDMVTMEELRCQVNQGMSMGCSDCGSEEHESEDCEGYQSCSLCDDRYETDAHHECPMDACGDCERTYVIDDGHDCHSRCNNCDNEFGFTGSYNHECPEIEEEESDESENTDEGTF